MTVPLATFVTPVFNAEDSLEETVRSALAQDEERVEVVLVDDGSTDGSWAVCERLAASDARVRIARRPNGGPAAARNTGLALARAEHVAFLDADDTVSADKVRTQVGVLKARQDVAVVYSDEVYALGAPGEEPTTRPKEALPHDAVGALLGGDPFPMCVHSAMHRRSVLEKVGGFREDPAMWGTDDYDLLVRIALDGGRFHYVPGPRAVYRIRPGSISRDLAVINRGRLAILESLAAELRRRQDSRYARVRSRARHVCLSLAREWAQKGAGRASRSLTLRSLRYGVRPGHLREVVQFLVSPSALVDRMQDLRDPKEL